jgi:hypothetical protein
VEALTFSNERIRVLMATPKARSSLARSLRPLAYRSVPIRHKTHSAELIQYAERQLAQPARYFVLLRIPVADRTAPGLMESLFSGELTECHWTCGKRLDIAPGDHAFMRRTRKNEGVIGYGSVIGGYVEGNRL